MENLNIPSENVINELAATVREQAVNIALLRAALRTLQQELDTTKAKLEQTTELLRMHEAGAQAAREEAGQE